jgi:two-component system, cell cycle response regulator DivK
MTASDQVVLVVEDNATNMRLVHDLLKSRGYTVLQARDGTTGWQMAQEHRPNLILLDIQLPDITGFDVISWLKGDEGLQSIPVIAVTAFTMKGDKDTCLSNGFDAYISKPISIHDFLQTVEHFLNSSGCAPCPIG